MHRRNDAGLLTRASCAERELGEIPVVCPMRVPTVTQALNYRRLFSLRDVRL